MCHVFSNYDKYDGAMVFVLIIDLMSVDTSGIMALEELNKRLQSRGIEVRSPP